jgi:hypothetical protein
MALPATAGATVRLQTPPGTDAPDSARTLLRKAEAVTSGERRTRGPDLTMLLKQLAVKLPHLSGTQRSRARKLLARPTMGQGTQADQGEYSVAEQPPLCSAHFCVHNVATTSDKPASASYVQTVSDVFEHVYQAENVDMGWRVPKPDGSRGCPGAAASCMDKTDVYLQNIGNDGLYGYAAPDPGQDSWQQHAYLVVDNDYAESVFAQMYPDGPLRPLEVTAAHEYNHVLQYAYSVAQETWMYEASASWMENQVYPEINDYFQYLPSWAQLSSLPLTNEVGSSDQYNGKTYGNAVWNQWITAKFTQDAVRGAWEQTPTVRPRGFSPTAYDVSLRAHGSGYFKAFTSFAADTAEWRASNSPFDATDHALFPGMGRVRAQGGGTFKLVPNATGGVAPLLHSSYVLIDVQAGTAPVVKLVGNLPRGARGAIALIGRSGTATGGSYVVNMTRMRGGGTGTVTLDNPRQYSRVTAALINGDARTNGRTFGEDWNWINDRDTDGDGVEDTGPAFDAMASTDFTAPVLAHRSPARDTHGVSRHAGVKVSFSERMAFATSRNAVLRGPGSNKVKATVTLRGRTLEIRPHGKLRAHTRYTVSLSGDITDRGGNALPAGSRSWAFTTGG